MVAIEAGKFYKTRDGKKIGPIETNKTNLTSVHWPFKFKIDNGTTMYYKFDGFSCPGEAFMHNKNDDLIEKWKEEDMKKYTPKFKVGDFVTQMGWIDQTNDYKIVEIKDDCYVLADSWGDHVNYKYNCETFDKTWFLVASKPHKFNIGDRVTWGTKVVSFVIESIEDGWVSFVKGSGSLPLFKDSVGLSLEELEENGGVVVEEAPKYPVVTKTVTVKEIVPGSYAGFVVGNVYGKRVPICQGDNQMLNAKELREAAKLFNELAEVLESVAENQ